MRKRPSSRRSSRGRFRVSDDYRVPFPGVEPTSVREARYVLTPLGHVFRDDGLLLRPRARDLRIKLNHGRRFLSVPRAVFVAFGNKRPKNGRLQSEEIGKQDPELACWRPWVSPATPIDKLTGRRSCATRYVKLAFVGDLIRLSHGTITPKQVQTLAIR